MSDLLFTCPKCSKNLVVAEQGVGEPVTCPDCRNVFNSPLPDIFFQCPACHENFLSPKYLDGCLRDCPHCNKPFLITSGKVYSRNLTCPSCKVKLELENDYYQEITGQKLPCPACNFEVLVPAIAKPTTHPTVKPPKPAQPATSNQLFCPACNAETGEYDVVCIHCGNDLRMTTDNNALLPSSTSSSSISTKDIVQSSVPAGKQKCLKCSNILDDGVVFCVKCGTDLVSGNNLITGKKAISTKTRIVPPCQSIPRRNSDSLITRYIYISAVVVMVLILWSIVSYKNEQEGRAAQQQRNQERRESASLERPNISEESSQRPQVTQTQDNHVQQSANQTHITVESSNEREDDGRIGSTYEGCIRKYGQPINYDNYEWGRGATFEPKQQTAKVSKVLVFVYKKTGLVEKIRYEGMEVPSNMIDLWVLDYTLLLRLNSQGSRWGDAVPGKYHAMNAVVWRRNDGAGAMYGVEPNNLCMFAIVEIYSPWLMKQSDEEERQRTRNLDQQINSNL